jgi:hypothetical protein
MFNQILSEIEDELGISFGPTMYCPTTFNPMKSVFNHGIVRHKISTEFINSATWPTLMGSEGEYIYDVHIKTLIKNSVINTIVDNYIKWGVGDFIPTPHGTYYMNLLTGLTTKMGVNVETLLTPRELEAYSGLVGSKSGLVKFKIKKHRI